MNSNLKKFKIVETVYVTGWNMVVSIRKIFDDIEVLNSKWADRYKQEHLDIYPLDLSDIKTWSSYQECAHFRFDYLDKKYFICTAHIYDGDNLYGKLTNLRFTAELKIPVENIKIIKNDIDHAFSCLLRSRHNKFLRDEAGKWMNNYAKKLLSETD